MQNPNTHDREQPAARAGPPLFDRAFAVVVFALLGALMGGAVMTLVVSWDTLKSFVGAVVRGRPMDDAGPVWKLSACAGIALGAIGGGWFGWDISRWKKRRER